MSEGDGNETDGVVGRQRDAVSVSIAGGTFLRSVSRLCGEITLNHYEVTVGDTVLVQWNIHPPPAANDEGNHALEPSDLDWIGLFRTSAYMYIYENLPMSLISLISYLRHCI